MAKEFSHLNVKEQLEAENNFMKMKLMLERGASFNDEENIHPLFENIFLRSVMEFERQYENRKKIRVFDKIDRPSHFKPVTQIADTEIVQAWSGLSDYLFRYGITVAVCSPNIAVRELYRFTTEELFEMLVDDIDVPGMVRTFLYDEYYPDHVYENARMAVNECISYILRKEPLEWSHPYRFEKIRLNDHDLLTWEEFKNCINKFKGVYDDLQLKEISEINCWVNEKDSRVEGKYLLALNTGVEIYELKGAWKVILEPDPETHYWLITEIYIDNIRF